MIRGVVHRAWILGETIYVERLIYGEPRTKPREVVPEADRERMGVRAKDEKNAFEFGVQERIARGDTRF